MTDFLSTLNEKQRIAASDLDHHVRIIAGAGSGKTRVLMARIAHLIQDQSVDPSRILAITFTNKATQEMKERLQGMIGSHHVRVSTIHALCVRILREDGQLLGYPRDFPIVDGDDQRAILTPTYKKLGLSKKELSEFLVLGTISSNKRQGISVQECKNQAYDEHFKIMAQFYEAYQARLNDLKAMDFDDLLLKARFLVVNFPEVAQKWQRRLDYIHVDEFQDVDPVQYELICQLVSPSAKLCVVGDPDQTIYTWRGADVDIILRFDRDFPGAKTIILDQNYRSTSTILKAANQLISHNRQRIEKNLIAVKEEGKALQMCALEDDASEARYVIEQIKKMDDLSQVAILYRSNYQSRVFEGQLVREGIAYRIIGGLRFFERQEIKDMIAYLTLVAKPMDSPSTDLAFERVINRPRRKIGSVSLDGLRDLAEQQKISYMEAAKQINKPGFNQFVHLIAQLKEKAQSCPLDLLLTTIFEMSGYRAMLEQEGEHGRIDNVNELKADLKRSIEENPELSLDEYLQDVALLSDANQESTGSQVVTLMTVHAAKGLEFKQVFLVGFNEGIFPNQRALNEDGLKALEEERRLAYVAITRAQEQLSITWNKGYSYASASQKEASRFVDELPAYQVEQARPSPKASAGLSSLTVGQQVMHTTYGLGVVVSIEGRFAQIAFKHPTGIKRLVMNHPALSSVKH